ncbi:MAG: hypothetical protein ACRDPJ_02330 [Nocardioidaceae bacterium]
MSIPFTVLFVCVGNVCRSPLAERLLRERLDALLGDQSVEVVVGSAGVRAMAGHPMEQMAAAELDRLGGSSKGFAARQLTERIVSQADLVLTATKEIRSRVLEESPAALRRAFTLTEFAALVRDVHADSLEALVADAARRRSTAQVENYDIADPIGDTPELHREVADVIDGSVGPVAEAIASAMRQNTVDAGSARS